MRLLKSFLLFFCIAVNAGGVSFKKIAPTNPDIDHKKVPIVYHEDYNISLLGGIEQWFHPFDTTKYKKIVAHLEKKCGIHVANFYKPAEKTNNEELSEVHTATYLKSLNYSTKISKIAEVPILACMPNFWLQRKLLNSIRYATAGTILGAQLALEHQWAINLSGGYHHAKRDGGEGFCFFADIPLAIKKVREKNPGLKVLVVDLDAHQGNGLAQQLGPDKLIAIFDIYNKDMYPCGFMGAQHVESIDFNYPVGRGINDTGYLSILKEGLPQAIEQFKPDLIIYNAGSDIFEGDKLGGMAVTKEGIIERDQFVFSQAIGNKVPILMVLSGGYSPESADIVGSSIENLIKKFNLIK